MVYSQSLHVFDLLSIFFHIPVQAKRAELQDEMTVLLVAAPNGVSSVISMELGFISSYPYPKGMMCFDVLYIFIVSYAGCCVLENCSATT